MEGELGTGRVVDYGWPYPAFIPVVFLFVRLAGEYTNWFLFRIRLSQSIANPLVQERTAASAIAGQYIFCVQLPGRRFVLCSFFGSINKQFVWRYGTRKTRRQASENDYGQLTTSPRAASGFV